MKFIMACGTGWPRNISRDNPDQLIFHSHVATKYAFGFDYGTNSVRALIINVADGHNVGT
jgi:hypothetical protein